MKRGAFGAPFLMFFSKFRDVFNLKSISYFQHAQNNVGYKQLIKTRKARIYMLYSKR